MAIINLYRRLETEEREVIDCEEGRPLYKIVDNIDWNNSLIIVNGNNQDKNYIVKKGDLISIKQYPSGMVGVAIGGLFALAGLTVGVAQAVDKKIEKEVNKKVNEFKDSLTAESSSANNIGQTEQIPTIRGASNQNANGHNVPLIIGKSLFSSYICGNGYSTISGDDGETQYYNFMLILGYNDMIVQDIRMGGLKIASNGNGEMPSNHFVPIDGNYRFTSGGENATQVELRDDSSEMQLYPQKVTQSNFSDHIIHTPAEGGASEYILKLDKFSAINPQKIEVEISFDKLYKVNEQNQQQATSVQIGIAISYDDGITWSPFGKITGSNSYTTRNVVLDDIDVQAGISGTIGVSTITRNKNKNLRFVATKEIPANIAMGKDSQGRDLLSNRVAVIRVVRIDVESTGTNIQDIAYLSAIRTWAFDRKKSNTTTLVAQTPVLEKIRNITTRMAFKIKATDFIKGSLDKVSCVITSKCPIWDGTQWTTTKVATQNPASNIYSILNHVMLGQHKLINKFNTDKIGELYEFCEEKGIKVNEILVSQRKMVDVLNGILTDCRSALILEGNKYSIWIDKPQTVPVTIFNNHNIMPDGLVNSKSFDPLPDAYLVKFQDEQNGYSEGQFYVIVNEGADLSNPNTIIESLDLQGITNYEQAYKQALYIHAIRKLRPESWERRQGIEGNIAEIGDLVEIQDDTISVGIGDGGEITNIEISDGHIVSITTDSRFNIADLTKEYAVKLNTAEGVRTDVVVFNAVTYTNKLYFATPVSLDDNIQYHVGDIVSFGIYHKETAQALVMGKKQNPDYTFDFILVPYQEGVYTADVGDIPEYDPKVTVTQPVVDVPVIPVDFNKIPLGKDGKDGKDGKGFTVFPEKSALVYYADNGGVVNEQVISDRIIFEQNGIPVPFEIGNIISPDGFEITVQGVFVVIKALNNNRMAKNGVIRIPINYSPVESYSNYVNENEEEYANENGKVYSYIETAGETRNLEVYVSYAKAIKGKKAPEYKGILDANPTEDVEIGDYYVNRNNAMIYQKVAPAPVTRMARRSLRFRSPEWKLVDSDTEPALYYERINDLTSVMGGLPPTNKTVVFVNAYFDLLLANTALIGKVMTKKLVLLENGSIESENFVTGTSGTKLSANGSLEAQNAKIRGDIEAQEIFIENMKVKVEAGNFYVGRYNATYQNYNLVYEGAVYFSFSSKWGNNFYCPATGTVNIKIGLDKKDNINTIDYELWIENRNKQPRLVKTVSITKNTPIGQIGETQQIDVNYGDTFVWKFKNKTYIDNVAENTLSNIYIDFYIKNENYTINALCGGFTYTIQQIYPTE